ncbi:MAG: hypothetical protein EOP62_08640 [Sphingomonadales bacterium]|nr:MAG: hypothetical protein EOP62_08640 [Sphingomonadales bacterium]
MVAGLDPDFADRLYSRAFEIQERKASGYWLPIMRYLAFRGHLNAMVTLAASKSDAKSGTDIGRAGEYFTAAWLYRSAYRSGSAIAAQNLAMAHFNKNDLAGYRHWLRRAARAGDAEAGAELKRFETRLPHQAAREIGRQRPCRRRELTS